MANPQKFTGLSAQKLNELLESPAVRNQLRARANRVLPTAKAIAYSTGAAKFAEALKVSEGTRPGTGAKDGIKRSYARVGAVITPELIKADGRTQLTRRMILRRAAHGS